MVICRLHQLGYRHDVRLDRGVRAAGRAQVGGGCTVQRIVNFALIHVAASTNCCCFDDGLPNSAPIISSPSQLLAKHIAHMFLHKPLPGCVQSHPGVGASAGAVRHPAQGELDLSNLRTSG